MHADYYFSDESSPTSDKPVSDLPEITPEVDSLSEWTAWTACPVSCGGDRSLRIFSGNNSSQAHETLHNRIHRGRNTLLYKMSHVPSGSR